MKKSTIDLIAISVFVLAIIFAIAFVGNSEKNSIPEITIAENTSNEVATITPTTEETIIIEETAVDESETNISEPWLFYIRYCLDGEWIRTDFTTEKFGDKIELIVDPESDISLAICSYKDKEFYLTEMIFVVKEGSEIVRVEYDEHMGNMFWHMKPGQSAVLTLNCGTDENPKWFSFSIETTIK